MTETEALARIRGLRLAGYRCQASSPSGAPCGARAKNVWPLTAEGRALCDFHAEELSQGKGEQRRRPRLRP
ncbi:hypothetical protein SEA_BAILEYBLU_62 [Arthrobacter phage BaileyBlu]|uniref:Uncharacterized protein n=1 Tax=Arthrobacter phage BaileyBlu TaxID=2910754 RepID=A0AA49BPP5_9CAUD|nr:hypothetical protein PQD78_gp61 [Arthrobacter phage BaileyBlu]UJQ87198.1 hypothetical protein SEA_BAILEYBLU_62 [Arthrobacter phage BaileyBlu]